MNQENGQKFGPLLQMERRKAGISQTRISQQSSLMQATINRLKNGGWVNVNDRLVLAGHAIYQEY